MQIGGWRRLFTISQDLRAADARTARRSPWSFVPPLYFMQAIPAALVNDLSPLIFKEFGVENAEITRWTSIVALPWAIKMLFGPFVELNSTRRNWILWTQILIVAGIIGVAAALHTPNLVGFSLALLAITALLSATCDIATDGFYLMSLRKDQQAAYAGILTTSARLGKLFCTSLIVMAAGLLQSQAGASPAMSWSGVLILLAAVYALGRATLGKSLPRPVEDVGVPTGTGENWQSLWRTLAIVATTLATYFALSAIVRITANGMADSYTSLSPFGNLIGWDLTSEAMRKEYVQLAWCLPSAFLLGMLARQLTKGSQTALAFGTFVRQDRFISILTFILFYRLGEAMIGKMAVLFYKDPIEKGGMALSTEQVGFYSGTLGVIGIIAGGIIGGYLVSKKGLRQSFWVLALCMHVPNLMYVWAAWAQPAAPSVGVIAFVDQFGYGVGFAAYMVYLMYVAQRSNFRVSHYAIATGLGVLTIQLSGILSGIIQTNYGYVAFFVTVVVLTIPGMLTLLLIPYDVEADPEALRAVE